MQIFLKNSQEKNCRRASSLKKTKDMKEEETFKKNVVVQS